MNKKTLALSLAVFFWVAVTACFPDQDQIKSITPVRSTPGSLRTGYAPGSLPVEPTISDIQGASHRSPLVGMTIEGLFGVVTAVKPDGFYMQSEVSDCDSATSEGVFVRTRRVSSVGVLDQVRVSGTVTEAIPGGAETENLPVTEIDAEDRIVTGRALQSPAPIILGLGGKQPPGRLVDSDQLKVFNPDVDAIDFYESLEGMLVAVEEAVVVGPTNEFGEIAVIPARMPGAGLRSTRGGILLQAGDANPERIFLDDAIRALPNAVVGDRFSERVVGVLTYSFGNYKLEVTEKPELLHGGLTEEIAYPPGNAFSIATYNIENFFAGDPRVQDLAEDIVLNLQSPDILALQEVQDNNGERNDREVDASGTYQSLIDAIRQAGGPRYEYVDIPPIDDNDGGLPGGNIRNGFLYRTDTGVRFSSRPGGDAGTAVKLSDHSGKVALDHNPGRIEPRNPVFRDSRKPLVVEFLFGEQRLFLINVHLASKGGDQPLFGRFQPPFFPSEATRLRQAEVIHEFAGRLVSIEPGALVIVLGDFNDFPHSPAVKMLAGDVLVNLITSLPLEERYTYNFEGNSEVLDQILASAALVDRLEGIDVVHINSEWPHSERVSDHDPVLVRFQLSEDQASGD